MTKELYIQFEARLVGDLTVPIEEGDPTPLEQLAEAAVKNEYPDADDIKITNVVEVK